MIVQLSRYTNSHSRKSKIKRLLWEITWTCFAKPTPRWCLNGWRCFLLRLFGAQIGKGCRVYGGAEIWIPDNFVLGDYSWLDNGTKIYCVDKIKIGANCVISANAFLCTASHDIGSVSFELKTKPITIDDCAWVASNAIILPGVAIGEGAVVAAGSVVAKNVDPWAIIAGNPAKEIGKRNLVNEEPS